VPAKHLTRMPKVEADDASVERLRPSPGLTAYFGLLDVGKPEKAGENRGWSRPRPDRSDRSSARSAKIKGCHVVGIRRAARTSANLADQRTSASIAAVGLQGRPAVFKALAGRGT